MKNVKLPLLGLSFVIALASCQKDAFRDEPVAESGAAALATADTAGWKSSVQWETFDQESFTVHYFTIDDAAITADVADNGLVLLFKKSGAGVQALPFEEGEKSDGASNYWYHQVAEGSVLVSCDAYGKTTPDAANSFKYFVITPEVLKSLETEGYTNEKLMGLNYTEAVALLGNAK